MCGHKNDILSLTWPLIFVVVMFISNYKNICTPYMFTCAFTLAQKYIFFQTSDAFLHWRCRAKINACPICLTHSRFFNSCQNQWYYKTAFALLLKLYEPNIVKQHKVCLIWLYNETWSKKERLFLFLTKIRNEYFCKCYFFLDLWWHKKHKSLKKFFK